LLTFDLLRFRRPHRGYRVPLTGDAAGVGTFCMPRTRCYRPGRRSSRDQCSVIAASITLRQPCVTAPRRRFTCVYPSNLCLARFHHVIWLRLRLSTQLRTFNYYPACGWRQQDLALSRIHRITPHKRLHAAMRYRICTAAWFRMHSSRHPEPIWLGSFAQGLRRSRCLRRSHRCRLKAWC
jgi:hypothetical protein